jgi:caffeoyl-CoA O-methyltransferase
MPIDFPEGIEEYVEAHTTAVPGYLRDLAAETLQMPGAPMLSGPVEGRLLETLAFVTRARLAVDVGTFTGNSAIAMAGGLAEGGRVVTCDVNTETLAIARRHIAASPYADRIEVREGPALDTIASLDGPVDLAFIDADKTNYTNYYSPSTTPCGAAGCSTTAPPTRTPSPSGLSTITSPPTREWCACS